MSALSGSLLPFFAVVRVYGEDRAAFLHNQFSNDIANLPAGHACYATYNTPKGRVIANMLVLNRGEDLLLLLAHDLAEAVVKRLRMYVLRSKVSFEIMADMAVAGEPPMQERDPALPEQPALLLPASEQLQAWQIPLPHGGKLWVGLRADLPPYHEKTALLWQSHELQSGYPWIAAASTESCVAQMLNQHLIGGVHFKKGCYPGQEIIARAQYRGQVKRGLVLLGSSACLNNGDKLFNDNDEEVGIVINQAPQTNGCLALAVIKFSAADTPLHTEQNQALVLKYAFFNAGNAA